MTGLFTLIIAILTVESSYIQNLERPAGKVPDTVQFWITPEVQWRIKTYSIDHDIHTYKLQNKKDGNPISDDFAINNIKKGYEDIIASLIVLKFHDPKDKEEVQRVLAEHKLTGTLEIGANGIVFYNPDNKKYHSQSTPE